MKQPNPTSATADDAPKSSKRDPRKLVKTQTPGIYRKGDRYVVIYREAGKQKKAFARTYSEARSLRSARLADRDRGESLPQTKMAFRAYLTEWIERYHGTGKRGFRENTRNEYRRLLDAYAHRYFGERLRLVDVTPHHLAQFVAWLADPAKQDGTRLSDSTIANVTVPVRACLATARREGLIRHNPASDLALPTRARIEEEEGEEVRVLDREQLAALIELTPSKYRTLITLMASTGLRVSEAIALQRRHLQLDGSRPHVRVRRAIVKRRVEPPKTRHGKRSVPVPSSLVFTLRTHLAEQDDQSPDALVFPSRRNTPLDPDNLRSRTLKPLVEEIGAPWAGFHTLRHTYASIQLANGVNVVQLSRALGHHSAAFTLDTYVHLLEGEEAPALDLVQVLKRGNAEGNVPSRSETNATDGELAEVAA